MVFNSHSIKSHEYTDKPPSYDNARTLRTPRSNSSPSTSSRSITAQIADNDVRTKNIPYQPSIEQQKYIDELGTKVTSLSATTTGAHTEYFDVLPSFQMFQSILKRDDNQFNENLIVSPPDYGDTTNTLSTPPIREPSIDRRHSQTDENEYEHEIEQDEEHYAFDANDNNDGLQPSVSSYHVTYGHSVLDNIDKLAKLTASSIDIQIYVTKDVPSPHHPSDLETRLKEYSNGDIINGYIVITNTTSKPIHFGLFTVSLEGTIKAVERKTNTNHFDINKFSKVLMKKFLKMYDLNASYNTTQVPNSAGIEYESFIIDKHDGCQIGLPDERILYPNTKYKKFFTFKFPNKLLDTTCSLDILPHILPPPSIGIDRTSFGGQSDYIQMNKALGYGFLSSKGTPLMTKDYSFDDMSISYSIEAKFIDKLNDKNRFSHDEINADKTNDYIISSSKQYFVRFVPDLKQSLSYLNEEIIFGKETYGSLGIDGMLFKNYQYLSTWRHINKLNKTVEQEIDYRFNKQEWDSDDVKHKNLIVANITNTTTQTESLFRKQQVIDHPVYDDKYFGERRMIGSNFIDVYGKKKGKLLGATIKVGKLQLFVKVPSQPIAYCSPKLVTKYNTERQVPNLSSLQLNPITSNHVTTIYNRDDQDVSKLVEISLVYESINSGTRPPEIVSIEVNIVAWSFKTDYPLPFEFNYDFFYECLGRNETNKATDITKENLQTIKSQTNNYIDFLKANKTFISKNTFLYLKSISTLGIKKDTISDFFRPITGLTNPEVINTNWNGQQTSTGIKFIKTMDIPLVMINKHNITLTPSFQTCLQGRLYGLQIRVKYKGGEENQNQVLVDVPIIVG